MVAGIKPTTFQAMVDRKSSIKTDAYGKITDAMSNIIRQTEGKTNLELSRLYMKFVGYSIQMSSLSATQVAQSLTDSVSSVIRSATCGMEVSAQKLSESAADAIQAIARPMDLQLFSEVPQNTLARLLDSFDKLNEDGQEAAADSVEALTHLEKYQKKED